MGFPVGGDKLPKVCWAGDGGWGNAMGVSPFGRKHSMAWRKLIKVGLFCFANLGGFFLPSSERVCKEIGSEERDTSSGKGLTQYEEDAQHTTDASEVNASKGLV